MPRWVRVASTLVALSVLAGAVILTPPRSVHANTISPYVGGLIPHVARGQTSPAPTCNGCSPPLGQTAGSSPAGESIVPVYWAPAGYSFPAAYKAVINGFLHNVQSDDEQPTNAFSVIAQYNMQYSIGIASEVDVTDAFWAVSSSGCQPDTGYAACLADTQIQAKFIPGRMNCPSLLYRPYRQCVWLILLPPNVESCMFAGSSGAAGPCSAADYCAYHSAVPTNDIYPVPYGNPDGDVYTVQPYPDLATCSDPYNGPQAPNGNAPADVQVNLISNELMDSITAWDFTWQDGTHHQIADECLNVFGTPIGGGAGAYYNQVIGGGHYYLQDEFSNEDFAKGKGDLTTTGGTQVLGCVGKEELPTASFTYQSPAYASTPVAFDASASSDADTTNLSYDWFFDDGPPGTATASGMRVTHTFTYPGTYYVHLTVSDPSYWSKTVILPVLVQLSANEPRPSLYTLDGWGGIHGDDTPPVSYSGYWPGWNIARAAHAWPGGAPSSGLVLDGWGGLHGYGSTAPVETSSPAGHYWPWFDIARDFAFLPNGTGGFVLDGWGGLHAFHLNGDTSPLFAQGYAYWPYWDHARKVVIWRDGAGGYVLDSWGGIHPFGINGPPPLNPSNIVTTAYWQNWNIARDIVLIDDTAEGTSGYVLDGWGGLHPFHVNNDGSIMPPTPKTAYWPGWDIARSVWLLPTSPDAGYTLDGWGGVHPFGGAPPMSSFTYWPGWDIAKEIWGSSA